MAKYAINWDIGFGPMEDEVESDSYDDAMQVAYNCAREDFESAVEYSAHLISEESE